MQVMSQKRTDSDEKKSKRYPSRAKVKYAALPIELHNALAEIAGKDERSVPWLLRRIVKEWLDKREQ